MMNKQKGNMYSWVDYTWNPIKGVCPHKCVYCYMSRFPTGKLRFDRKCMKDNLGKNNTIFVGSSTDMFAEKVPSIWIEKVLKYCKFHFPDNTYLFQSKNPNRFKEFISQFPNKTILGTTLETNRTTTSISKAPLPSERAYAMAELRKYHIDMMVSIEPILDFDLEVFINYLKDIKPIFVSVGADSKNSNLPEPNSEKLEELIKELKKFTEVKIKTNLFRLYKKR